MSVLISDEKLLSFAYLISPSKMILVEKKYQTFDTVFHHQMKHLEVRQKYSAARRIFNSLLGVSSADETLRLMFDILRKNSAYWQINSSKLFSYTRLVQVPGCIITRSADKPIDLVFTPEKKVLGWVKVHLQCRSRLSQFAPKSLFPRPKN